MKLGILLPEFPTQTHIFFWREIQALRSLDVTVRILSTRRPTEACPHDFGPAASRETHYVFPPKPGGAVRLAGRPRLARRALTYALSASNTRARLRCLGFVLPAADLVQHAAREALDHLHVHSCADAAHIAALARLLGGPPYSLRLHGDLTAYGSDHRQKMNPASFVACAARAHQEQVIERVGLEAERTCTIPMGVDTEQFSPSSSGSTADGTLELVTVARLARGKGHRFALEAIRAAVDRGADVGYTIVGSGAHRPQIEADVERLGLEDRVRLLGALGEEGVLAALRQADVFVLASVGVFEAAPVSVMEAMSCGLPAIVSRIGGTPDMVSDGLDGFVVEQRDVGGLTNAIERLARDAALRRRMSAAARRRAVAEFDRTARARLLIREIEKHSLTRTG